MEDRSHTATDTLDQTEEEILTASVPDEALEAAAGTQKRPVVTPSIPLDLPYCCC